MKKNTLKIFLILVYFDDIIITGDDELKMERLKMVASKFDLKDIEKLKYSLRIELARSKLGLVIN